MTGTPLSSIGGGLVEGMAPTEQPIGSYSRGQNVRGIDPRTGRVVWAAQRAGLSTIGDDFTGGYPVHFATAFELVRARDWVPLTSTAQAETIPAEVLESWATRLGRAALDVAVGPDGQAYYLLDDGDVAILNRKGREVGRVGSTSPKGFAVVPRLFVGEDGGVYVAVTRDQPFEGAAGRVSRWVSQEDGSFTVGWVAEIETRISTFGYHQGVLYVAEDAPEDEEGVRADPALVRISSPLLGPEIAWREVLPMRPVIDLAVNDRGQALLSVPPDPERAGGGLTAFTRRSVSWTPPELVSWVDNAWAWIDFTALNDEGAVLEDGSSVRRMRDRRFELTEFAPIVRDTPVRDLISANSGIYSDPVFDQSAFGGLGAVKFSPTSALVSRSSRSLTDENLNEALIPGMSVNHLGAAYRGFTIFMIVQFTDAAIANPPAAPVRILTQFSTAAGQPSYSVQVDLAAMSFAFRDLEAALASGSRASIAAANTAILTIEFDDAGASTPRLYVNGHQAPAGAVFPNYDQYGPYVVSGTSEASGPITVLGGGHPNRINLMRESDTELSSSGWFANYSSTAPYGGQTLLTLHDGIRSGDGGVTGSGAEVLFRTDGGATGPYVIQIDLGTAQKFDTLVFWGQNSNDSAKDIRVEVGDDPTFVIVAFTSLLTLDQNDPGHTSTPTRNEVPLTETTTSPYRYVRITALTFWDARRWRLNEIELLLQDTNEADHGAEFYLGEMVVRRRTAGNTVDAIDRERFEGYLGHRFGVSHTLLRSDGTNTHAYRFPTVPPGVGFVAQTPSAVSSALTSPFGILAKYSIDGRPIAAIEGGGVGLGARTDGEEVYTTGKPQPVGLDGSDLTYDKLHLRLTDEGSMFTLVDSAAAGGDDPELRRAAMALGPCNSLIASYTPMVNGAVFSKLRRWSRDLSAMDWEIATTYSSRGLAVGGFQIDFTDRGGACGPEYVFVAADSLTGGARRVDVMGLQDTGRKPGRDAEQLVVLSNGDVVRQNAASGWDVVESAALPGDRPASATMFGKTIFCDGLGYRVYDHANGTLRDFEEAVAGEFPARCRLIAAYRSRLVLAGGDNAFTTFQSRFGDVFDFDYGPEVQSISQAIAGTTASQGKVPEQITALMPYRDDMLYIGTTESLFVQTGDLADGGRLDQVDKSQGVAFGYAWCEGPFGIYYFSGRGGVVFVSVSDGIRMVSSGKIQRRLEEVDLSTNRVELAYNWIDKTVHIFVIPNDLGSQTEHFVYEEPTRAWHIDGFGEGYERSVTAAQTQVGDTPEDRALLLGFAGGYARRWDQYAEDDAGNPVQSHVVVGPLINGPAGVETRLTGIHGQLATDQAGVEVAVRGSSSADAPGPPGAFQALAPGRSLGVGFNVCAPAVFVEVRGTGRAWCVHELRAEAFPEGTSRAIS